MEVPFQVTNPYAVTSRGRAYDEFTASLPADIRDQAERNKDLPLTGPEAAAAIQLNPKFRFDTTDKGRQEFRNYTDFKSRMVTDVMEDIGNAMEHVLKTASEGVYGVVMNEKGEFSPQNIAYTPFSAIEATLQGTRDLYGMVAHSEDPNSVVFSLNQALFGNGTEDSRIAQLNQALQFGEDGRRFLAGETSYLPDAFIDNRQVQAMALFLDLPTVAGVFTGGAGLLPALTAKLGKVKALSALRGLNYVNKSLELSARVAKMTSDVAGHSVRGSAAAVRLVSDAITKTVDTGVNIGGKVVEFGTGLKAAEVASAVKKFSAITPFALPIGVSVPVVQPVAMTYMGAKAARGMAEAFEALGDTIRRNYGQRSLVSFAEQTIADAAASGMKLSDSAKKVLTVLDKMDPVLSGGWTAAKSFAVGGAVGGVLGFLNGGVQGWGYGVGTGGSLGLMGGTLGFGLSKVFNTDSRARLENSAAFGLNTLNIVDKPTVSSIQRLLGFKRDLQDPSLQNTSAHREMLLKLILHLNNMEATERPSIEAFANEASINARVEELRNKGYTKEAKAYEGLKSAGGFAMKGPDGKIKILINEREYFKPGINNGPVLSGASVLAHELDHTLGMNSKIGPIVRTINTNSIFGSFREEVAHLTGATDMPGNSHGYRMTSRGLIPWADVKEHLKTWARNEAEQGRRGNSDAEKQEFISLADGIVDKLDKFGADDAPLLSAREFELVRDAADEFMGEHRVQWWAKASPELIFRGGRRVGLNALSNRIGELFSRVLEKEVNHSEPLGNFDSNRKVKVNGVEYTESVDMGFVDQNLRFIRYKALDSIHEATLRLATSFSRHGFYDLSELPPSMREMVVNQLGLDDIAERDAAGRVTRSRKKGKGAIEDKVIFGPEAVKALQSMERADRTSVDTVDGGIVGPFSDKELRMLTDKGYMSQAYADKVRMLQMMYNDPRSNKIIMFDYHGASMQLFADSDNARIWGDKVPVTSREAMVVDLTLEFNAKGEFVGRVRSIDTQVLDRRMKDQWAIPGTRELWNNDYDAYHTDFYDKYLRNASLPADHPDRVPSAQLWDVDGNPNPNGEKMRNVMHQVAGFAKADDYTWLNLPIAQIPRGTMMTMTDFSIGRMGIVQTSNRRGFTYEHKNAFHDISRNFRPRSLTTHESPAGKIHENELGYQIVEKDGKFRVFHPASIYVGDSTDIEKALGLAERDFEERAATFEERRNKALGEVHAQFSGVRRLGTVPQQNVVGYSLSDLHWAFLKSVKVDGRSFVDSLRILEKEVVGITVLNDNGDIETPYHGVLRLDTGRVNAKDPGPAPYGYGTRRYVNSKGVGVGFNEIISYGYFMKLQALNAAQRGIKVRASHGTIELGFWNRAKIAFDGFFALTGLLKSKGVNADEVILSNGQKSPAHMHFASHMYGAGSSVYKVLEGEIESSRTVDENGQVVPPSYIDVDSFRQSPVYGDQLKNVPFTSAPIALVDVRMENPKFVTLGMQERLKAAMQNPRLMSMIPQDAISVDQRTGYMTINRRGSEWARIDSLINRHVKGELMLQAIAEGHDGLVLFDPNGGKYRELDYVKLYPEAPYPTKEGEAIDDKVEIVAKSGKYEDGKLVFDTDVYNMVASTAPTVGGFGTAPTSVEIRRPVYFDERQQSYAKGRDSGERSVNLGMARGKSLSRRRLEAVINDTSYHNGVSVLEHAANFARKMLNEGGNAGQLPFPATELARAPLEAMYTRWQALLDDMEREFDAGTMTEQEFNESKGDAVRQWEATMGELMVAKSQADDIFYIASSLDDDFNNLAIGSGGGMFLSGGQRDSTSQYDPAVLQVAEIGPHYANVRMDRMSAFYLFGEENGVTPLEKVPNEDIFKSRESVGAKVLRQGRMDEFKALIDRYVNDVNSQAGSWVRAVYIERKNTYNPSAPVMSLPTLVWTSEALSIRDAYRQKLPRSLWANDNFEWNKVTSDTATIERIRQDAAFVEYMKQADASMKKAAAGVNQLYSGFYAKATNRATDAINKHDETRPLDYDTYKQNREQGRNNLKQKALNSAHESLKADWLPEEIGEHATSWDALKSHREEAINYDAYQAAYEQAKQTPEGLEAFAHAFNKRLQNNFDSRLHASDFSSADIQAVESHPDSSRYSSVISDGILELMSRGTELQKVLEKTLDAFEFDSTQGAFVSGLRTAFEQIVKAHPNGITAPNFRKELQRLHSQGIPSLEEARVTGFLDYLAEKEKLPKLPNGKAPKLDIPEMDKFLESTKMMVLYEPNASLNSSSNFKDYHLRPNNDVAGYGVLAARMAPEIYYPSKHNSAGHLLPRGMKPQGGSSADDTILYTRHTIRDFKYKDDAGRWFKERTFFVEEMQANNDAAYARIAEDALDYRKKALSAIEELVPLLQSQVSLTPIGVAQKYAFDMSTDDGVKSYYEKVLGGMRLYQSASILLTRPHELVSNRFHEVNNVYTGSLLDEGIQNNRQFSRANGNPALDFVQDKVLDDSIFFTHDAVKKVGAIHREYATRLLEEAPKGLTNGALRISQNDLITNLWRPVFANKIPQRFATFLRDIIKNPSSAAADNKAQAYKYDARFNEIYGFKNPDDLYYTDARLHNVKQDMASFAAMMPEAAVREIHALAIKRYNEKTTPFAHHNSGWPDDWAGMLGGGNFSKAVLEIVEKHLVMPEKIDGPRGGFGEATYDYAIPSFRTDNPGSATAQRVKTKVRFPGISKKQMARIVLTSFDLMWRKRNGGDSSEYSTAALDNPGLSTAAFALTAHHQRMVARFCEDSYQVLSEFTKRGYRDQALAERTTAIVSMAEKIGVTLPANFRKYATVLGNYKFGSMIDEMMGMGFSDTISQSMKDSIGSTMAALNSVAMSQGTVSDLNVPEVQRMRREGALRQDTSGSITKHEEALLAAEVVSVLNPGLNAGTGMSRAETAALVSGDKLSAALFLGHRIAALKHIQTNGKDPKGSEYTYRIPVEDMYAVAKAHDVYNRMRVADYVTLSSSNSGDTSAVLRKAGIPETSTFLQMVAGNYAHPIFQSNTGRAHNGWVSPMLLNNKSSSYAEAISKSVQRFLSGGIKADEFVNEVKKQSFAEAEKPDGAYEAAKRLSRVPFLSSDEYLTMGVRIILKKVLEMGDIDAVSVIPWLDGGSRSGLPKNKIFQLYGTLIPSKFKKELNALGLKNIQMPGRPVLKLGNGITDEQKKLLTDTADYSQELHDKAKKKLFGMFPYGGDGDIRPMLKPVNLFAMATMQSLAIEGSRIGNTSAHNIVGITSLGAGDTLKNHLNSQTRNNLAKTMEAQSWMHIDNKIPTDMPFVDENNDSGKQINPGIRPAIQEIFSASLYYSAADYPRSSNKMPPERAAGNARRFALDGMRLLMNLPGIKELSHPPGDFNGNYVRTSIDKRLAVARAELEKPEVVQALWEHYEETFKAPGYPDYYKKGPREASPESLVASIKASYNEYENMVNGMLGEISSLHDLYRNVEPGSFNMSSLLTRGIKFNPKELPEAARKKIMDEGQFFYRGKQMRGRVDPDSRAWRSGFIGNLAENMAKVSSGVRIAFTMNSDANASHTFANVSLYPRGAEDLTDSSRTVEVRAAVDLNARTAVIKIENADLGGKLAVIAADEMETRLRTLGVINFLGDGDKRNAYRRLDTRTLPQARPVSYRSAFSQTNEAMDVTDTLYRAGYHFFMGTKTNANDERADYNVSMAKDVLNDRDVALRVGISKNSNDGKKVVSDMAMLGVVINGEGEASFMMSGVPDDSPIRYEGGFSLGADIGKVFKNKKKAESVIRKLLLSEMMYTLKELGVTKLKGFEKIVLPNEDVPWYGFQGTTDIPRSYLPQDQDVPPGELKVIPHGPDDPAVSEYLRYKNSDPSMFKYGEFTDVVRRENATFKDTDSGAHMDEFIPKEYFYRYGGFFYGTSAEAKVDPNVAYRPKRHWSASKTGNFTTLSSTDGYIMMMSSGKKWKLYTPNRVLLGIYEEREEAFKRADKHAQKGK